jgi:5-methylcytosine-specific restriction protein A
LKDDANYVADLAEILQSIKFTDNQLDDLRRLYETPEGFPYVRDRKNAPQGETIDSSRKVGSAIKKAMGITDSRVYGMNLIGEGDVTGKRWRINPSFKAALDKLFWFKSVEQSNIKGVIAKVHVKPVSVDMVEVFKDVPGDIKHQRFQEWRRSHPTGYFLNLRNKHDSMLHRATCKHHGDRDWQSEADGSNSLTKKTKICSLAESLLRDWAKQQNLAEPAWCSDCLASNIKDTAVEGGWGDDELKAAVLAYLRLQKDIHNGAKTSKAAVYRTLAKTFGRSEKAFEYRMQNISYVLSLMGRQWLDGLKPAKNVGVNVAAKLERLICEANSQAVESDVAFDLDVKEKLKQNIFLIPKGSQTPSRTLREVTAYQRDSGIKAWVLKAAKGACECCKGAAPFACADGQPYLEVHHLLRLAEGGSDTVSNAVALCPNCHRNFHYGSNAKDLLTSVYSQISRLIKE